MTHRVGGKSSPQLAFDLEAIAGKRHELIVRRPAHDLDRTSTRRGKGHGNIDHANLPLGLREIEPEWSIAEPVSCHTLQAHARGVPLDVMVDTVFAGRLACREAWPDRARSNIAPRLKQTVCGSFEHAPEVGQPNQIRFDHFD